LPVRSEQGPGKAPFAFRALNDLLIESQIGQFKMSLRRDFPEVTWHTFEEWARKQD
jgi:hypothetical protein